MLQGFSPHGIHDPFAGAIGFVASTKRLDFAKIEHMAAKGPLGNTAFFGAAKMHTASFQPKDLLPARLTDFFDDILIRGAVRALPGVEHVVYDFVRGIVRVNCGHAALGCGRMGLLRAVHLGHSDNACAWTVLAYFCSTSEACSTSADHQHFGPEYGIDLEFL